MRSVAWLTGRGSDMDAAKAATQRGLEVAALSAFIVKHRHNPALILGFAGSSKNEIRRGVVTLAAALRDLH